MFKWSAENLICATGGRKINCHEWVYSSGISTDTRNIKKGNVFVALKGKNFDGHDFLDKAFSRGAIAAIVCDSGHTNFPLILVKDTLKALHGIASYYIKNVLKDTKVIAITGSIGKTTTKDMLQCVLEQYGVSYANIGNFNNNIGLPLTVINAPNNCQYLILEMGMNKPREIKELSEICNPDIAVITNIEYAHTEYFSSLNDIANAKLEVMCGMKENATLIVSGDSKLYNYLLFTAQMFDKLGTIVSFSRSKNSEVRLLSSIVSNDGLNLKIGFNANQFVEGYLNTQGEHFISSALAVASVIYNLGLDLLKIPDGLKKFSVADGRGKIHRVKYKEKSLTLIDDSYNASPASMKAAIKTLSKYSDNRRIALLGDMLELGNDSKNFHLELFDSIVKSNLNRVYTVGKFMLGLNKISPRKGKHFSSANQLIRSLDNLIKDNDVILVKGSRGIKMDLIVKKILSYS